MAPSKRGRLRVLLGAAPGVGKTFAMLVEGQKLASQGVDVVVALAETHHREGTEARLRSLEQIAAKRVTYRGTSFEEMDTDAVIARRPEVALIDELAHTNVPGGRHIKRWQDVEEILAEGIDVITNINVQHIDSLNDSIESLTGVAQRETVPDALVAAAESVELIDIDPELLRRRLASSDVLAQDVASAALSGYFTAEHIAALRDLALGWLDTHNLLNVSTRIRVSEKGRAPASIERVVAALTDAPEGEHVLRRAAQIAKASQAELIGLHARKPSESAEREPVWLDSQRRLLAELGGRYAEIAAEDVATAVLQFADAEHARQLVLGATRRSRLEELLHGSVINRAIRHAGPVEVHVIPAHRVPAAIEPAQKRRRPCRQRVPLPLRRRQVAWVLAIAAPAVVTLGLAPFHNSFGLAGALFCALVAVVGVAALGGLAPAALATVVGFLLADYFFTPPFHSLRVDRLIDVVALIAFVVTGGIVGYLVDVLARQGLQAARARATAESLARVVADVVVAAPDALGDLPGTLRRALDLTAVAVLRSTDSGWQIDAAAGQPIPQRPEEATRAIELSDRRVLALLAVGPSALDAHQLDAFVNELRLAGERYQLERIQLPDTESARSPEDDRG